MQAPDTVEIVGSANNDGHYYKRDSLPIGREEMQDLRGLDVILCSEEEAAEKGVYKATYSARKNSMRNKEDQVSILSQSPIEEEPVRSSMKFARKNSMRNKPCGCGSGKKFKKCCWNKFNGVTL